MRYLVISASEIANTILQHKDRDLFNEITTSENKIVNLHTINIWANPQLSVSRFEKTRIQDLLPQTPH